MLFIFSFIHGCSEDEEDEIILDVECHFSQAKIGDCIFDLGDCAYIEVLSLFALLIMGFF